jgi:hypothetical protein
MACSSIFGVSNSLRLRRFKSGMSEATTQGREKPIVAPTAGVAATG